jgi:hypothetical protein
MPLASVVVLAVLLGVPVVLLGVAWTRHLHDASRRRTGTASLKAGVTAAIAESADRRRERLAALTAVSTERQRVPSTVRCPTCGSGDVHYIDVGSKAFTAVAIGVLSVGFLSKTFRCHNCRYRW